MSNIFHNYIFIYYRKNHKYNIGTIETPKKLKLKKLIKINND